jgi:hypothetical protein
MKNNKLIKNGTMHEKERKRMKRIYVKKNKVIKWKNYKKC